MIRGGSIIPNKVGMFKRFNSIGTNVNNSKISIIDKNSIYVIALPITTKKSFIYCHHRPSILSTSQAAKFPIFTKFENKITDLVLKGWTKLSTSKISVNVKVTKFVRKLLNSIHYEEACLRSFPSKRAMIREINEEAMNSISHKVESPHDGHGKNTLIQTQIEAFNIPLNQIKPIPLYHPKFINASNILTQLYKFRDDSYAKHFKYAIISAIGIPLSLPFALVPVLPNVPGFYIAYRFYCNIKALMGINHLKYLLDTPNIPHANHESDANHLRFKTLENIDVIYQRFNNLEALNIESIQQEETLIISNEIIDDLTKELNLPELKEDLKKALRQETIRLNKHIKVDDLVE